MNYQKIYDNLIDRARNRILEGYSETHHVIPRCMGGSDESGNLVILTAREHFVAHLLLIKIYPKNTGLVIAVHRMTSGDSDQYERMNNRLYDWIRKRCAKISSDRMKANKGKKWQRPERGRKHSETMKKKYQNGYKSPKGMLGKKHSDEWKKQTSERMKINNPMINRIISKEERLKRSIANSGEKNGFYGKKHNQETKVKMRKPKTYKNGINPRIGKKRKVDEFGKIYYI